MNRKSSYASVPRIVLLILFSAISVTALAQTGVIKGKVKEQGGKALEGVTVQARKIEAKPANDQNSNRAASRGAQLAASREKHETTTDSKGNFSFSDLTAGNYVLTFEKPGFAAITTWQMEIKAGETVELRRTVELPREKQSDTSLVRGGVFNAAGFSFPNVSVKIERIGGKRFRQEKYSNDAGEFVFRVPSEKGTYRITASASGFQTVSKEIEIDASEVRQVALTLEKKQ
ncbi:MAG TPA: carboxypeptidase-like regulatory domain-containing protein [Blastocatellia bacterium]|nr:carboxypeptidase-like regulatory domain-containing protein [Blastocatellia bacterium]